MTPQRAQKLWSTFAVLMPVVSLVATVMLFWMTRRGVINEETEKLSRKADVVRAAIQERIAVIEVLLEGASAYAARADGVTAEWQAYGRRLDLERAFPDIWELGLI